VVVWEKANVQAESLLIAPGQYVGTLQWSDATGKVRRWTLRRGIRSGSIRIDGVAEAKPITRLLTHLRGHLATYFRTGFPA